jgi:hypothetical protein
MRSMYRFSVIALAVGALALFGIASTSYADAKVVGVAWAGLGIQKVTPNDPATAGYNSVTDIREDGLAEINFTGGVGNVTARARYRVLGEQTAAGGTSKTPAAVRSDVTWKVSDALSLDFMNQSFGLPEALNAYSAYTIGVYTSEGDIGDLFASPQAFFVNNGGLDIRGSFGAADVGVMILGNCKPACSNGADTNNEERTLIPHLMFKAGAITIAVYDALAQGKTDVTTVTGTTATPKNSEISVNGRFKTDAMDLGLEYVTGKDQTGSSTDGSKYTGMAVGGKFGPIGFHYVTNSTKDAGGAKVQDVSEVALAYTIPLTEQADFILGVANRNDKLGTDGQIGANINNLKASGAGNPIAGGAKDTLVLASVKTTF